MARTMHRILLILLLVTTIFAVSRISAQDVRATIGGRIVDTQGGLIPNAQITIISDDSGVKRATVSNSDGLWQVEFLLPGHYHFTVNAPGFKTEIRNGIELQAADIKSIDVQLQVGSETQSITVNAAEALIDTTAAVSGTVINSNELEELPTQSHLVTLFATLSAGVQQQDQGTNVIRPWSNTAASQYEANGGRNNTWSNTFNLDGMPNTKSSGEISFLPPVDSVQEFRVQTNAYDASIGRQSGATINMTTRSGGKDYHGVLYEYDQNSFANARIWGSSAAPSPVHYNQFGGTFGGPVWIPRVYNGKDRTFFFVSFDKTISNGPELQLWSVPTALERQGDFSQTWTTQLVNGQRVQYQQHIYNPFVYDSKGNRTEFTNEQIPSGLMDPVAKAIMKFIPLPNQASDGTSNIANNYSDVATNAATFPELSVRADQNWNNNHHSFLMIGYSNLNQNQPNHFHDIATGQYLGRTSERVAIDHVWTMGPTRVLDLRANVARFYSPNYYNGAGYDPTQLGFPASFTKQLPKASFPYITGVAGTGTNTGTNANFGTSQSGSTSADTNYTFGATMTQVIKSHTLHYGVEYWVLQSASSGIGKGGGEFDFDGSWTKPNGANSCGTAQCNTTASFDLGLPSGGNVPINASGMYSQHFYVGFVQEDWRVNDKLTLNAGIRYDVQSGVTERYNRLTDRYDPNAINPINATANTAYAAVLASPSNSTNQGVIDLNTYMPASNFVSRGVQLFAGVNGTPRGATNASGQWQPRVGFAYKVFPNTVVKGGFGRFTQAGYNEGGQNGFSRTTSLLATQDNYLTPYDTLSNPFRGGILAPTGSSLGALTNLSQGIGSWDDPNLGRQYNYQGSLQVQQQVGRWLASVAGSYENQKAISWSWETELPSFTLWQQLQTPQFNSDGSVVALTRWNNQVPNPYYNLAGVTGNLVGKKTIAMNQLLNPVPYQTSITENRPTGTNHYYALQSQVERRYHAGMSFIGAFTWSKLFEDTSFLGPQIAGAKIEHKPGGEDRPFNLALTGVWDIPVGRGQLIGGSMSRVLDAIVGGWEVNGKFSDESGLVIPFTTDSFWSGKSAALSKGQRTLSRWFDTSQFVAFPSSSTDTTNYPTWTGLQNMPGGNYHSTGTIKNATYNDFQNYVRNYATRWENIRQQGIVNLDAGVYKNFQIHDTMRLQLRMSAFNATNHPRFGTPQANPGSSSFGQVSLSAVNQSRQIELGGKLYF